MNNRICYKCGSSETYIRPDGRPWWGEYNDNWYCRKHYREIMRKLARNPPQRYCKCGCYELLDPPKNGEFAQYKTGHFLTGSKNNLYRGGVKYHAGYKYIRKPDHPRAGDYGYVAEHRLIMEAFLERYLTPDEEIDHFNENKLDNHITNLILTNNSDHLKRHYKNRKIDPKTGRFLPK